MNRKFLIFILFIFVFILAYFYYRQMLRFSFKPLLQDSLTREKTSKEDKDSAVFVLAENLDTPWGIAFLPDGGMLLTERQGTVRLIDEKGKLQESPVAKISSVVENQEGGLLGIDLHPDFSSNGYVYLYYTYKKDGENTFNRVVRMVYEDGRLKDETIILDKIPASGTHNGGRIKFGPDKMLYITTGDSQNPSLAQDINSLAGKILRVTDDGKPAFGNPFANEVYSYGHRNPQGIAWDEGGVLWETEHGPSGFETGNDEFNKIEAGKNYGWPLIRGKEKKEGMVTPIVESGKNDTWAPAGLSYLDGKFYFGGLRGEALYRISKENGSFKLDTFFKGEFGRIREVVSGPDGMLYITTSNKDGRGKPKAGDDKVIRIDTSKL